MSRISFVVPRLHKSKFSGGLWCIFEYAHGLADRGHDVRIIPVLPSAHPEWYPKHVGQFYNPNRRQRIRAACTALAKAGAAAVTLKRRRIADAISQAVYKCCLVEDRILPYPMAAGMALDYFLTEVPPADIAVATSFNTARAVSLMQAARKYYFAQHFEPYFKNDFSHPQLAEQDALESYRLGLRLIANSSWLQRKLKEETGNNSALCPNAIDLSVFNGSPRASEIRKQVVVISYGGRNAEWKGFRDMCAAVALARRELPNNEIVWKVYGDSLIPPNNAIASYQALGFLKPMELAEQYRKADILLSASWYESFPLFPIEAMACGIPAITTALGTEDYATQGETAEIVKPRDPEDIARGLIRLIADAGYRHRIAAGGYAKSQEFTWDKAVSRMDQLLHQEDEIIAATRPAYATAQC
jgi:glycosyltransferase involved in cell wall biosynthesis